MVPKNLLKPDPAEFLPVDPPDGELPAHLERLADQARDYAKASSSANTQRAYASDWRHFESWCRRNLVELRPDPQTVGLSGGLRRKIFRAHDRTSALGHDLAVRATRRAARSQ